jgi:ferredoxin-NADP reductase
MDPLPTRYTTTLKNRIHEYDEVYTFIFEKPLDLTFNSGNYAHIHIPTVLAPEKSVREISFASAPSDEDLMFTMITSSHSPWQTKLLELKSGSQVELFKIKGHLVTPLDGTVVMIANGIGITPFRSIIREHFKENTSITPILVHIAQGNYLYEKELSELTFEQYRITRDEIIMTIDSILQNHRDTTFMLAGSPAFVESMKVMLVEKNILESNIQVDSFKGLTD